MDRPLFDTHNQFMDEYKLAIGTEAIIDADRYNDYFHDEKSKHESNLRDIFADIYSDMHCDISSSIPCTSNIDVTQYYNSINNNISTSSSNDSLTRNMFDTESRKKLYKYSRIFETDVHKTDTESFYERYYVNKNISPLTSPCTDEDDEIVTNKHRIDRISTPVPQIVPEIMGQTRPSLPTLLEIAESKLPDSTQLWSNAKVEEIKNINSWLKESKHMEHQLTERERYASWITLRESEYEKAKIKKNKPIDQLADKHTSCTSHLCPGVPKTIQEEYEIDVESISNKSSIHSNEEYKLEMEGIHTRSHNDTAEEFEVGFEDNEIKSITSVKATNEETESLRKLELNISKSQISAQVNLSDFEESSTIDKQNNLESYNDSKDVYEISVVDSCENKNISINTIVKTNTASSIPSLNISLISKYKTLTWYQKISKCFCCQWNSIRSEIFSAH